MKELLSTSRQRLYLPEDRFSCYAVDSIGTQSVFPKACLGKLDHVLIAMLNGLENELFRIYCFVRVLLIEFRNYIMIAGEASDDCSTDLP